MKHLDPGAVRFIVLHCTDSLYGSVELIDQWHRERGWEGIGYHWLITNCYSDFSAYFNKRPDPELDGTRFHGRPLEFQGAHAKGWNNRSVGVALVGRSGFFTGRQIKSAIECCLQMLANYPIDRVIGHNETGAPKTCPELDMAHFRELLKANH